MLRDSAIAFAEHVLATQGSGGIFSAEEMRLALVELESLRVIKARKKAMNISGKSKRARRKAAKKAAAKIKPKSQYSVSPADYCYNLVNKGLIDKWGRRKWQYPPLFEAVLDGDKIVEYVCYGLGHPYTGLVYWRPRAKKKHIGDCVLGRYYPKLGSLLQRM